MEQANFIKCPICGFNKTNKLLKWEIYTICNCKNCHLVFSEPFPTQAYLDKYYQGFLFNKPEQYNFKKLIEKRKTELAALFDLKELGKSFLDYGGGTGSVYKAACDLGLNAYYFDLDKEAEEYVRNEFKLDTDHTVNDITKTEKKFEYIFSDNVIEHLIDPVTYIADMRGALANNGEIVIKTPNARSTASYFYPWITIKGYFKKSLQYNSPFNASKAFLKRYWYCDPPRHLYSFSKKSLEIIAQQAGFFNSEISIDYYHIPLFKYSVSELFFNFSKYHSLRSIIIRIGLIPILPFELLLKIIQFLMQKAHLLSPTGIILKLKKDIR